MSLLVVGALLDAVYQTEPCSCFQQPVVFNLEKSSKKSSFTFFIRLSIFWLRAISGEVLWHLKNVEFCLLVVLDYYRLVINWPDLYETSNHKNQSLIIKNKFRIL